MTRAAGRAWPAAAVVSWALETLLNVIDELPVVVDPFHQIVIDHARRALDEARRSLVTR